jgi:hypothetical protein
MEENNTWHACYLCSQASTQLSGFIELNGQQNARIGRKLIWLLL